MRKLLVFDVDSTLIEQEVIELIAQHHGSDTVSAVEKITESAMRGELDFEQSLRARVKLLAGIPVTFFDHVASQVRVSEGIEQVLDVARQRDVKVACVSGGFLEVLTPLAKELEIDLFQANRCATTTNSKGQQVLTGELEGEIIDRQAKAKYLEKWATELGLDLKDTIAVGDGANDLDMVRLAGLGVGYRAKEALAVKADLVMSHHTELLPYL